MPSPCMQVQRLMGEPPPILLYCSWILGVRRLAMKGPSLLQSQRHIRQNVQALLLDRSTMFERAAMMKEEAAAGGLLCAG